MGLFDKRDKRSSKKDDFDSPVERIDLSAPAEPEPVSPVAAPIEAAPTTHVEPPPPEPVEEFDTSFGIDKAIELMRTLPSDNIELVVQVVKLTLESTKIKITTIIEDASRKQEDIQGRIKVLKAEIAEFEKEIATRREEIGALEADFDETSTVKERLMLAEQLSTRGSTKPADGSTSPLGKLTGKPPVVAKK